MSASQSKALGILESLPRDVARRAVLRTLSWVGDAVRTKDLLDKVGKFDKEAHLDPESASEVVQSAIREGLIDVSGEDDELRIRLTPYGEKVAKSLD